MAYFVYFSIMQEASEILSLFQSRMRDLNMTQTELGQKAFGKPDNTAIQSLKKGSSPGYDRVAAMAKVLGLELYLGPPRGEMQTAALVVEESDYVPVPLHEAALSELLPVSWTGS